MDECITTLNEAKKRCTGADSSFKVNITDLEEDVQHQKDVVQKRLSKVKGNTFADYDSMFTLDKDFFTNQFNHFY